MFDKIKQGDRTKADVVELVLDSPDDLDTLPTNVGVGSTAICISTADVYIFSNSHEWKPL